MVTRDTQKSRKIDIYGYGGLFFLTFGFKDGMCDWAQKEALPGASPSGEPLLYSRETLCNQNLGVFWGGGEYFSPSLSLQGCQLKGRCWRIKKGDSRMAIP
jgi:hypothetical protein